MADITVLNLAKDVNGFNSYVRPAPNYVFSTTLIQDEEQNFTVPPLDNASYKSIKVIFSFAPGSQIWVAVNDTAELPGASFSLGISELNPTSYWVSPGDVISFITSDASDTLSAALYS